LGIPIDARVLTLIGNCGGAKNHEFIPEVLHSVEQPIHVLHVGHSRYQSEREGIAWRGVPKRHVVHHLGERGDVPSLLAASDALLQPSLYEGFGLTVAEALCAEVPVLAADSVGLRWLSQMASAKLLPLEEKRWASGITTLLGQRADAGALRQCAAAARARFRPDRGVDEYLAAYRSALEARPFILRPAGGPAAAGAMVN
jgi:glycosyltransferase involved in cell wall biosynthesis